MVTPRAGEIWDADLDPTKGREQGGFRPVLVISNDLFNDVPHSLCIVVPLTRTDRGVRSHVRVEAGQGGLAAASVIMCEQVRSVSLTRLKRRRGSLHPDTVRLAAERVASYLVLGA